MGKNGAAMRAAKQNKTYTVTSQWLDDHDRQVIEVYKQRVKEEATRQLDLQMADRAAKIKKEVEETWNERERLFTSGDFEQNFLASIQFLLAISSRILIEKFHWSPIPEDRHFDKRNRLARFTECIIDEIDSIQTDELQDIRTYCAEVERLYNVKFQRCEE